MSEFQVYLSGTWTTPPSAAKPVWDSRDLRYPPIVLRAEPAARSGSGLPIRMDDELFAVVGRPFIDATGLSWWYSTLGFANSEYLEYYVRLFDPQAAAWSTFRGYLWKPTYGNIGRAGTYATDFRVRITNLVSASP